MAFTPQDRPRVAVATDGTIAAIREVLQITIVTLPEIEPIAVVHPDPEATTVEVGWLEPARLLVLSRYRDHATAQLFDPRSRQAVAELRLEPRVRLAATTGACALLLAAEGAAVLTATSDGLVVAPWRTRDCPETAGSGAGQFLVALGGLVQEWDPTTGSPRRAVALPANTTVTRLGGTSRFLWMTALERPAQLQTLPFVRGPVEACDFPEPLSAACGNPQADLVACIGDLTGRLYVARPGTVARSRVVSRLERIESAGLIVAGGMSRVLVAQSGRPLTLVDVG